MMLNTLRRLFVFALLTVLALTTTSHAQTDYYFNPPTGVDSINGVNVWNNVSPFWSTTSTGPDDYSWASNGSERANFGNTAGSVTLGDNITAYGINFTAANYVIAGGGNTLTLAGAGGVINNNVVATISAPINGSVGLSKTGSGTLTLSAANTYSGNTTVSGGTVIGLAQLSGSPFSSGAITLNGAILNLKSLNNTSTTTTVGNFTVSGTSATTVGTSNLIVENANGAPSTTFAAGNLVRGGVGSALVVTPVSGTLGTSDIVTFANGSGLVTNGILPPWVVTSTGTGPADFVTYSTGAALQGDYNHDGAVNAADYVAWRMGSSPNPNTIGDYNIWRQNFGASGGGGGGTGVVPFSSYAGNLTTSGNTSVVNQTSVPTITGNVAAYALKTDQAINLSGNTLTLGNGSGQAGLILNAGSVTGGNVTFGTSEGVVYAQGTTAIGSAGTSIASNGLTVTALGASNLTLAGNIVDVDGSHSAKLNITGITSGTSITLGGTNTYTGGTTLSVNTSTSGNVFLATDSAFGTGKVTNIIVPGTSSDQLQASGGDRTLANPFDLNGGMNFTGTNSFTFTGPLTIINSVTGGSRTLGNLITTAGKSVTFGSSGSPSTITLGNPVANGGDGVGKTLGYSANASSLTVINDVMQDPAAGGGTASGNVVYSGSANGVIRINSQNTYSGTTGLNGASTVQIAVDSVGSFPSITSGPFGTGTLIANNATNNPMRPVNGSHTIANPILLTTGFQVSNETSDPSAGLTFTGPITFTNSRTINNAFTANTGGTLTLGSAVSPSTITLSPTATNQTLTMTNTGTTVVNDAITEPSVMGTNIIISGGGNATYNGIISTSGLITISAGGGTSTAPTTTIALNPANTYTGGTSLTGVFTVLPITGDSVVSGSTIVSSPFGTGTISINNGSNQHIRAIGADRTIPNPISMITGFAMDNTPSGPDQFRNLTFSGPISMNVTQGRFISNGFTVSQPGGTMIIGDPAAPSTVTLANIANATLDIAALSGPIVLNDVIQDGTFAGLVRFNTNTNNNSPITINGQSTFTGTASIGVNGFGNIQLGCSSVGDFGAITSGPFGVGTLVSTSTAATTPAIVPLGANRTVSNAITLNGNLGAANAGAETFNLNFTGPISLGTAGRSIKNNMAGTLTLGQSTPAASTNAITLAGTGAQALTFSGNSTSTTVVNEVIQNGGGGIIPGVITVAGSIVQFNNANAYGPTTPGSSTNTTVTGGTLLVNNTSGSGTGVGNVSVTGGVLGGTGTISQSVTISGGAIAPGSGGAGTLNIGTNVTYSGAGALNIELGGTTPGTGFDQLLVGGQADLTAGGTLNVSLINGFNPSVDTDFTVLTATGGVLTIGGTLGFTSFNYPAVTHWSTSYTANSVVVHYSAAGGASLGGEVPEPTALLLLLVAAGAVLFCPRRAVRRENT